MFTEEDRDHISAHLIKAAAEDEHITAAALVGSAASDTQDKWSDIDLAFEAAPDRHLTAVADHWSQRMYTDHAAQAHLDIWNGPALYRVFVLRSTLQIDLSFWPAGTLAPTGDAFRWLFSRTDSTTSTDSIDSSRAAASSPPSTAHTPPPPLDMSWLHALHARSSIARGRRLQALHMLNQMRDHIAAAACQRLGLPSAHARGVDDLPVALRQQLLDTIARDMTAAELRRCLQRLSDLLVRELANGDPDKVRALSTVLADLAAIPAPVHTPSPEGPAADA